MHGAESFLRRRCWVGLPSVVGLAGVLACGGSGEKAPEPEPSGVVEEASGGGEVDACAIVTEGDASALFGQPASPDEGTPVLGGAMLGQCLWTWDTESSNQLLQFSIWTAAAYGAPDDSEPIDLGDGGYVRSHPMAGVDVSWLQDGRTINLNYSTIGPDAPKAPERVEAVKDLAREVASRL